MSNLILYPKEETSFNNNGIGVLQDVIEAKVMERLNGEFELSFKYPAQGSFFSDVQEDCYVTAPPSPGRQPQPFRIYKTTKVMAGYITVLARHRAYNLRRICVSPFEAGSAAFAMQQLKTNAVTACPFEFWTDKETVATMKVLAPSTAWDLLGGTRGSILDTFGGEYEFDGNLIRLRSHRGSDQGVTIRYGKNLIDLQQERNIAEMITGVYPFWRSDDGEEFVQLPEKVLKGPGTYSEDRDIPLDLSKEFKEKPTEEDLRARAQKYMDGRSIGKPTVSLKIKFSQLEKTEEYKNMAFLERVELGDDVTVAFPPMCVDVTARVVATEFDPILDHYISVTIGRVKASISSALAQQEQDMQKIPGDISEAQTELQAAIKTATDWLTNGLGFKVERRDGNGNTVDTLYMDTPDINQAKDVLRVGQSGIGFSHTGVSGPYVSAWTIDGKFNADFITTGILNANLLRAGVIMDKTGKNYWDLDKGEAKLNFKDLKINGVTPQSMADSAKDAAIKRAETIAKEKVDGQTQTSIFNKLTNNGKVQGLYIKNGQLYINASYIVSGILNGDLIKAGKIQGKNGKGFWDLDGDRMSVNGDFTCEDKTSGWKSTINKLGISFLNGQNSKAEIKVHDSEAKLSVKSSTRTSELTSQSFSIQDSDRNTNAITADVDDQYGTNLRLQANSGDDTLLLQAKNGRARICTGIGGMLSVLEVPGGKRQLYIDEAYMGMNNEKVRFVYSNSLGCYVLCVNNKPSLQP